jgi:hypothetical protein
LSVNLNEVEDRIKGSLKNPHQLYDEDFFKG